MLKNRFSRFNKAIKDKVIIFLLVSMRVFNRMSVFIKPLVPTKLETIVGEIWTKGILEYKDILDDPLAKIRLYLMMMRE